MRIGVFFTAGKHHGGVYQYSLAVLEALSTIPNNTYTVFTLNDDIPRKYFKDSHFKIIKINDVERSIFEKFRYLVSMIIGTIIPKLVTFLYHHKLFWLISIPEKFSQQSLIKIIESQKLDLIIYPTSSNLSFMAKTPSIVAIHDLAHRLYPQFPEVSVGGRWELREYSFIEQTKYAKKILVDSEIGKQDVLNCYPSTDPAKIVVLPFLPPSYLNKKISPTMAASILKNYHLPENYFYYPAKFWPHKHHKELLEALKLCHDNGYKFSLVFTGATTAEFSTFESVKKQAKALGLENYVNFMGYIENEKVISAIYKKALALIMPTNFGPTNIPILEAWAMRTPVIYSNVRGCKQQLGNAGISIPPDDPDKIAKAMIKIATNPKLAKIYSAKGKIRLSLWTQKDFIKRIRETIKSFE